MISSVAAISIFMAKSAFFWPTFLAGESQDDHDKRTETFLENDGFSEETLNDASNNFLINLLIEAKSDYRENYYEQLQRLSLKTVSHTYNQLDRIFKYNRIQIMRLRLLIQPDYLISINKTFNREQKYSVMRGYWVDDAGKKVLKFNVNLGNTEKVMFKNGDYDYQVILLAKKEIKVKMTNSYIETYGPLTK